MRKKLIISLLYLITSNFCLLSNQTLHLDNLVNNTNDLLHAFYYNGKNIKVNSFKNNSNIVQNFNNPLNNFVLANMLSPNDILDFYLGIPASPISTFILKFIDQDMQDQLANNSQYNLLNIAAYMQCLNGTQLNNLVLGLNKFLASNEYTYDQGLPAPESFNGTIYLVLTNFNPYIDSSSSLTLTKVGYKDQVVTACYRIQFIDITHCTNPGITIQINKENLGLGLLTPDSTGGHVTRSTVSKGIAGISFLYPSCIKIIPNGPGGQSFYPIIDMQGQLKDGQLLQLDDGMAIIPSHVFDVGGGFHQDIPMLNLSSKGHDSNDNIIVAPNNPSSDWINLYAKFDGINSASIASDFTRNTMMFSLPKQRLIDGVQVELTQDNNTGEKQLKIKTTKNFTDSLGYPVLPGSVLVAPKLFGDLKSDFNITIDFLRVPGDSTWKSPGVVPVKKTDQTLNFNLKYFQVPDNNQVQQNILIASGQSEALFPSKYQGKVSLGADKLKELSYLWYFDSSYKTSTQVPLNSSFVDKINNKLKDGKSIVLNSTVTKKDNTFSCVCIAYDLDSQIAFAVDTQSITNQNPGIFSIGMIYNSVTLGKKEVPLPYISNYKTSILFSVNKVTVSKGMQAKVKKDGTFLKAKTENSKLDKDIIRNLKKENKELKNELQQCLAQKKVNKK